MSENQLKSLDFDTLICFVQGLIEIAKVDGISVGEKEYIEAFLREELNHLNGDNDISFEELVRLDFNIQKAKSLIVNNELKEYFFKSCIMLACVDGFTNEEKSLIESFADNLNYSRSDLNKVISEVQNELMEQFKDITLYHDSLKEVAKSIGLENI